MEKMDLNNPHNPRFKAARYLLKHGLMTAAEVANFAGCTRQHMHRITQDLNPRQKRARYLKQLWAQTLEENSHD